MTQLRRRGHAAGPKARSAAETLAKVEAEMCASLPSGHVNATKKYFCLHDVQVEVVSEGS